MRVTYIGILILFLLAACATLAPQVTVTSEVTVTLTPTATLTPPPTFTPTVTFTPAPVFDPELISTIESALLGVTVVGDGLRMPNGDLIEGLTLIDLGDGNYAYERAPYEFATEYGETINMPATRIASADARVDENGKLCIPAHCWDAESNQWVRKKALAPDGIIETEYPTYSKMEAMAMWLLETLDIDNPNWRDADSPERAESQARSSVEMGTRKNSPDIQVQGMDYYLKTTTVYDSRIYILDEDGNPVRDESGLVIEKPIRFMNYAELSTGQSVAIWIDAEGEKREIMIDGGLGDIAYFYENDVTPFTMTQAEYDAIMASLTSGE